MLQSRFILPSYPWRTEVRLGVHFEVLDDSRLLLYGMYQATVPTLEGWIAQHVLHTDSHRQRIINWINAAGGTSSAFDVTTKVMKNYSWDALLGSGLLMKQCCQRVLILAPYFLLHSKVKSLLGFGVPFLQGILHSALHGEFWRLIDPQGKPPGVMGWWPSRAVTFLENHDTGSTQVPFVDGTSYARSFLQWKRYVGK
jgi:hypothetical protein